MVVMMMMMTMEMITKMIYNNGLELRNKVINSMLERFDTW